MKAIHHLDGNPNNHKKKNLQLVNIRENNTPLNEKFLAYKDLSELERDMANDIRFMKRELEELKQRKLTAEMVWRKECKRLVG